ncbi:MAG: LysR family transcriptional regulator [Deltaproteobacteria bacterium]|nr:LysR family transcriptional regulator [Deltaproteobacteria bacterium]
MKKTYASVPPVDFDLRQLEIFLKVVELGSFSKAGEAVHLAQASVSERIATLENMVGAKLLDRMGRTVAPTKAGELLYRHGLRLLELKEKASLEMQDFLGVKQGEIHIGASTIPGEYILPEVIGRFAKEYPLIRVVLTVADSEEIEFRVLQGDFEFGIIGRRSSTKKLLTHELWEDDLVLVVPSRHRWASKKEVTAHELADEPFLSREVGSGTLSSLEDYLQHAGVKGIGSLRVIARLGTSTAVKEGVKAGAGVSILSSRAVETELKAGVLTSLKIKGLPMSRHFYLIRDRRRTISPLCRTLLDFLIAAPNQPEKVKAPSPPRAPRVRAR